MCGNSILSVMGWPPLSMMGWLVDGKRRSGHAASHAEAAVDESGSPCAAGGDRGIGAAVEVVAGARVGRPGRKAVEMNAVVVLLPGVLVTPFSPARVMSTRVGLSFSGVVCQK